MRLLSFLPLLWFFIILCALLPLPLIAGAAFAQSRPPPTHLQSGNGDLIRVQRGGVPRHNPTPRSMPSTGKKSRQVEAADNRLVTVCLKNSTSSGIKAFDIRRGGPPRFAADSGGQACTRLEPIRHTITFWKAAEDGTLQPTLTSRLDLGDTGGTQVTLNWIED